jgi:HAMP domain-containing protein
MAKKLNPGTSISDVRKGLEALNGFWKAGYMPDDLERHFFFTWFADSDGRILQAVKKMGLHRNTFQNYFAKFNLAGQSIKLRRIWQSLEDGKGKKTFNARVLAMYRKMKSKTSVSPSQNDVLIGLWLTGFPSKMMQPSYVLWATRAGKDRTWIQKRLDFSMRHTIRIISKIADPKLETGFWMAAAKPKAQELYKPRYRTRLKKRGLI